MKKVEKYFFIALFLTTTVIHLVAYRVWLFSTGILSQGDWILSLPNYSKSLLSVPIMWKSYAVGSIDLTPPFYIFLLLEGLLSNLGFSYGVIERVTFMGPIAILTIPCSYLFIKTLTKNKIAALSGAVFYAYNTYFIMIQSGHLTLMTGFALAPLLFYLFSKTIENRSLFFSVLTGIVAFIISFYEFRAFYLVTLIAFLYYGYYIFFLSEIKPFKVFKQTIAYTVIPLIIVLLLNIYWILPYMLATVSINDAIFNRDLFGTEFFKISNATTLFHPFWTGGKYAPFSVQPIPFYFFFFPIAAFVGLYLNRKDKKIIFFGLLAILGIFLAKQNNAPFPDVYYWLYGHVPGFGAFREASKFYFFVGLSYSVLIGALVDWLWTNWKKDRRNIAKYVIILLLIGGSVWNLKPLIEGSFGNLFENRTMPQDYQAFNTLIDQQDDFFRTLWIPSDARWGTNTNLHPKVGQANMSTGIWKQFSKAENYKSLGSQYIDFYQLPESKQLLNNTSIKYIIVPLVDIANDDNFFALFGKSRAEYIQTLDKLPYLKKISISNNNIKIYENSSFKPHFYISQTKNSLLKDTEFTRIKSSMVTNSEYIITLNNISKPVYLHFTDSYHPDWRLHVGTFSWTDLLQDKNYFLPNDIHAKDESNLNMFYIDPKIIKQNVPTDQYSVNKDGSINASITLFFVPQAYSYFGIIISAAVFILLILYLLIYLIRKYAKKN